MNAYNSDLLIVKFGALGDVVRTAYLLPALAAKHPRARIHWWTSPGAVDLLRFNPHIYSLVAGDAGRAALERAEFEFAISLDDEREILEGLSKLRVKRTIGARLEGGERRYCDTSASWFDMGLISRHGKTRADELKRLNQREHHTFLEEMIGAPIPEPSFFNSSTLEASVRRSLPGGYFHVGLNSGSGGRWPSKQLPLNEAVTLVRRLAGSRVDGRPIMVWLLGGRDEAARTRSILEGAASGAVRDPGNDQNLLEFAARVKALDLLITSDSLALHMAVSQKVPSVSFFAPTSAAEIGTFGLGAKVVSTSPDYCNYRSDADNSTLTADRIFSAFETLATSRIGPVTVA
jgi:heptosyltransferase II